MSSRTARFALLLVLCGFAVVVTASVLGARSSPARAARLHGPVGDVAADLDRHAAVPPEPLAPQNRLGLAGTTDSSTVIVDDLDPGFRVHGRVTQTSWRGSSPADDVYDGHASYTFASEAWVGSNVNLWGVWTPDLPDMGDWEVYVYVPAMYTERRDTTEAVYRVTSLDGVSTATADHTSGPGWVSIGTYFFDSGTSGSVRLDDVTPDYRYINGEQLLRKTVLFDAVKWVYRGEGDGGGGGGGGGEELPVRWLASPSSFPDCRTPEPCCWSDRYYADSSWTPVRMPLLNHVSERADRFYRGYFDLPVATDVQISFRSDDGLWLYLDGELLGEETFSLWFAGCTFTEGCFNGGNPATGCGLNFNVAPVWARLEAGRHVIAADLSNALGGSYLDVRVRAALPETSIAAAIDRGDGGRYEVGDALTMCYSVSRPVYVRFLVCPDGEPCRVATEGDDDGRGGCIRGPVGGTPSRRRLVAQALASGRGSSVIAEDEVVYHVTEPVVECRNDAELFEQSSHGRMDPGDGFEAYFEVKNTGECAWEGASGHGLRHVGGSTFGEDAWIPLNAHINPSSRVRYILRMQAPGTPGQHTSTWQLEYQGDRYGPLMSLTIDVRGPSCTDDADVVSFFQGGAVQPGQAVPAWVELRNSGSCTWRASAGYELVNTNGQPYGAPSPQELSRDVAPGGRIRFTLDMTAPSTEGEAISTWRMRRAGGQFGATADVRFRVSIPPREVDLGFRPDPNGHRANNKVLYRTEAMFRQFFGDDVVAGPDGELCANAKVWLHGYTNAKGRRVRGYRDVADGYSCVGFSLTSLLAFRPGGGQAVAGSYAMPDVSRLYDERDTKRYDDPIRFYSGVQVNNLNWNEAILRDSWGACGSGDVGFYVDQLRDRLGRGELTVLGMLAAEDSHAVVPYRIEDVSDHEVKIWIYDSEYAGQERAITVRRGGAGQAWQWNYPLKGMPQLKDEERRTCGSMFLVPLRDIVRAPRIASDICSTLPQSREDVAGSADSLDMRSDDSDPRVYLSLPADATWQLVDEQDRRVGWGEDGLPILEIPEAVPLPSMSSGAPSDRHFSLPLGAYRVEAAGRADATSGVAFADGRSMRWDVTSGMVADRPVVEIDAGAGRAQVLDATPGGELALSAIVEYLQGARTVEMQVAANGALVGAALQFDGEDARVANPSGTTSYSVTFASPDQGGVQRHVDLQIGADEEHWLTVADWGALDSSDIELAIDRGRDGSIDHRRTLRSPGRVYLPVLSLGAENKTVKIDVAFGDGVDEQGRLTNPGLRFGDIERLCARQDWHDAAGHTLHVRWLSWHDGAFRPINPDDHRLNPDIDVARDRGASVQCLEFTDRRGRPVPVPGNEYRVEVRLDDSPGLWSSAQAMVMGAYGRRQLESSGRPSFAAWSDPTLQRFVWTTP